MKYVIEPKWSALMEARIGDTKRPFEIDIPADDAELAAVVGVKEDGTPKVTMLELAHEQIATQVQVQFSKLVGATATRVLDADGKPTAVLADNQPPLLTDEQIATLFGEAYAPAYRILVGERAAAAGRQSEKAKYDAKEAQRIAEQSETLRAQFASANSKTMRQMVITFAQSFGFNDLAAELSAQL